MIAYESHSRGVTTFTSKLGWFGALVNSQGIERLHFGYRTKKEVLDQLPNPGSMGNSRLPDWWKDAQNLLIAYSNGDTVDLSEIPLSDMKQTSFQQRVVKTLQQVGYGQTITYKEVARRAGSPGAARAVGNQMAKNCVPLVIPCHRVVASGGKLGGFSAPEGLTMKVRLLEMEKVDCEQFQLNSA